MSKSTINYNMVYLFFQSCSSMFGEVSSNLDTMDTEARAAPLQFRASMVAQVRTLSEHNRNSLHGCHCQVRRYRSEVSTLQTSLTRARVERMSSSQGAGGSSGVRESSGQGGGGAVTDQHRQQVGA